MNETEELVAIESSCHVGVANTGDFGIPEPATPAEPSGGGEVVPLPRIARAADEPGPVAGAGVDIWDQLLAECDANLALGAGMDIRQVQALTKLKQTLRSALARRQQDTGPVVPGDPKVHFLTLARHQLDALAQVRALLEVTPKQHREQIQRLLEGQLALVIQAVAITLGI